MFCKFSESKYEPSDYGILPDQTESYNFSVFKGKCDIFESLDIKQLLKFEKIKDL